MYTVQCFPARFCKPQRSEAFVLVKPAVNIGTIELNCEVNRRFFDKGSDRLIKPHQHDGRGIRSFHEGKRGRNRSNDKCAVVRTQSQTTLKRVI